MSLLYKLSIYGMVVAAIISTVNGRGDLICIYLLGAILILGLGRVSQLLEAMTTVMKNENRILMRRHVALMEELMKLHKEEDL